MTYCWIAYAFFIASLWTNIRPFDFLQYDQDYYPGRRKRGKDYKEDMVGWFYFIFSFCLNALKFEPDHGKMILLILFVYLFFVVWAPVLLPGTSKFFDSYPFWHWLFNLMITSKLVLIMLLIHPCALHPWGINILSKSVCICKTWNMPTGVYY